MSKHVEENNFDMLNKFQNCSRYIDDLLCINNDQAMDAVMNDIYPSELNLTTDGALLQSNYLDLGLEVVNNKIRYKLFDKRDAFGFEIVNFPDLSGNIPRKQSYGVFVSQLIRYARCCQDVSDFRQAILALVGRLTQQRFSIGQLRRSFVKFVDSYYDLVYKYGVNVCDTCLKDF